MYHTPRKYRTMMKSIIMMLVQAIMKDITPVKAMNLGEKRLEWKTDKGNSNMPVRNSRNVVGAI
jgi:hypothetical protein